MGSSASFSLNHSEFNEFLFASVGEQENGMSVSVFSALTRLGVDPWGEAKRLSELPGGQATQALDELVGRLVEGIWNKADTKQIAARLIRLLPNHMVARKPNSEAPRRVPVQAEGLNVWIAKISALPAIFWLAAFIFAMGAIYVLSSGSGASWTESQRSNAVNISAPQN